MQQTVSQNAVLVNGKGQLSHSGQARGQIAASECTPAWDYVLGDATPAYQGRLERCRRHVVFVKPSLILLCDELAAPEPATFQLMLHGLSEFELDAASQTLHLQQQHIGLTVQYLASKPLALKQWDGFLPKPLRGNFANHWHVEAGTSEKTREAILLTLLAPHQGTTRPSLDAKRLESDTAIGLRATVDGKSVRIAVRKSGVAGPAELDGLKFDKAVLVQ